MSAVKINRIGKFDLNPRGNLWHKDEDRFGHKLLSKMGWSQGKGLGKNEDGIKENIRLKVNTENTGVGYRQKFPLASETAEYDSILSKLNEQFNNSPNNKSNEGNKSTSIEKRSQEFKNRLHYRKFVRGKDVGRYSEKDFNSIFVSKMPKSEIKIDDVESSISNVNCPKETEDSTTTFKSSLSMKDYFEMKMKNKAATNTAVSTAPVSENMEVEEVPLLNGKKSKKKRQLESEESCNEEDLPSLNGSVVESNAEKQPSKRKKLQKEVIDVELNFPTEAGIVNGKLTEDIIILTNETKEKKKPIKNTHKAKKIEINSENGEETSDTAFEHDNSNTEASQSEITTSQDTIDLSIEVPSEEIDKTEKKKKCKTKLKSEVIDLSDDLTSDAAENSKSDFTSLTSKRKKLKAKRTQKQSVYTLMEDLKSCLKSGKIYSIEKEARRVSFSEQVACRLLTTKLKDGEDYPKSKINDIVLPCTNDSPDTDVQVVEECSKEETLECKESSEALEEEVAEEEAPPNCLILPKTDNSNYNSWLENQRIASKMKVYKNMVKRIKKNPILKTTNLLDIKGYGNWGI